MRRNERERTYQKKQKKEEKKLRKQAEETPQGVEGTEVPDATQPVEPGAACQLKTQGQRSPLSQRPGDLLRDSAGSGLVALVTTALALGLEQAGGLCRRPAATVGWLCSLGRSRPEAS